MLRKYYFIVFNIQNQSCTIICFDCFLVDCISIIRCTVWIGGNDRENEGHFVWSRDGNPITFNKWDGNNPDDFLNNEDCIEMRRDGIWNDIWCGYLRPFVCEKDIN